MITYKWSILETFVVDAVLKSVKYWCQATDGKHSVETEGNWKMLTTHMMDEDTTEHQVSHWLDMDATQNDKHLIKYRLQEQLDALSLNTTTRPPWAVDTFKVTI
jgi:hypothetical protein